jgi:3-oxoadipate enol-lactonase
VELTINGARIHYRRDGAGFPVLLLHAGIADSRMWEPQVGALAEHFDVIRPDTRGFGDSELPPQQWSQSGDVLALMDALELKQAHLVGCSMGGATAIDMTVEHPERTARLVLIGAAVNGANFGEKYPELWAEAKIAEGKHDMAALNEAEARLWLDGPGRPRGYVGGRTRDLFLDMNGRSLLSDYDKAPDVHLEPAAIGRLTEITAPTLVVLGDADAPPIFDTADVLMSSIKGARRAMIRDAAHLPNLEHPDEFNRLVLGFLRERALGS